jgi:hypothetical protein
VTGLGVAVGFADALEAGKGRIEQAGREVELYNQGWNAGFAAGRAVAERAAARTLRIAVVCQAIAVVCLAALLILRITQ